MKLKQIGAIVILVVVLLVGVATYTVFRAPEQASSPITAIPLADAGTGTTALPANALVFQVVQGESEARFIIDEVLNDQPKTVIGTTRQVAGQIAIDPENPAESRVGVIQINARDLTTDSEFRNRAIKNQILQTDQYEFITFSPTEITGLPSSGVVGQSYTFQMVGDLTIGDVTKQATFEVTTRAASEDRLTGTATTTIAYADYGISIPQVRQVASVDDQVRLELEFVAVPA